MTWLRAVWINPSQPHRHGSPWWVRGVFVRGTR